MLGYGARLAYGCNIGAYFSGIASASVHGWLACRSFPRQRPRHICVMVRLELEGNLARAQAGRPHPTSARWRLRSVNPVDPRPDSDRRGLLVLKVRLRRARHPLGVVAMDLMVAGDAVVGVT